MLELIVALPFMVALLLSGLRSLKRTRVAWLSAVAPLLAGALLLKAWFSKGSEVLISSTPWLAELGLNLSFRLDGLSLMFALLVLGVGLLVIIYAAYYLGPKEAVGRFYALLLLFMGAMLGLVLAENLLMLVMFWELTSLSSFLLVGFWSEKAKACQGARMALTVTAGGGLALLAGVLLIGQIVGSFELSVVLAAGEQLRSHALYPWALVLVLLGAFTKSAQFPFHFWLPQAMAAPTPVSAYLHSATLVKAGIFLLARLYPALSGSDWWLYLVSFTGLITLLWGALLALFQHDLKGLLAYSTISHLGLITLLLGLDTPLSNVAALFHVLNHATFKASLFMAAGIIDHETGSRDMRKLNGLWRYMPYTAVLAMVASSAMAGVPLLNGFLSKEMFFGQTLEQNTLGVFSGLIPLAATLAGVFSVAYSLRFIHDVFFNGQPVDLPKFPPHEPPHSMRLPAEILVLLCLLVGVLPNYTVAPLLEQAVRACLGYLPQYSLTLWHGFNLPLLMSSIALILGAALYAGRKPLFVWFEGLPAGRSLERFEQMMRSLQQGAFKLTRLLENGSLQRYLALLWSAAVIVVLAALAHLPSLYGRLPLVPIEPLPALALLLMSGLTLLALFWQRQRLKAVLAVSVIGLLVVLLFAFYGAADLALTQLVVELVTLIALMLALYYLPSQSPPESSSVRLLRDAMLALAVGVSVALLSYALMTYEVSSIFGFFLERSVSEGGGHNAVNVILVDFRGFDTFGEITVLLIAALTLGLLLKDLRLAQPTCDPKGRHWAKARSSLLLQNLVRVLLPLALLVAVFVLLRGHNAPGGGFVAGLIAALIVLLHYIAHGTAWVEQRLGFEFNRLAAAGLLIAGLTGLASGLFGKPFLTSAFGHIAVPGLGEIELASAMLFDLGVFAVVLGATLSMVVGLGKLSLNSPRP